MANDKYASILWRMHDFPKERRLADVVVAVDAVGFILNVSAGHPSHDRVIMSCIKLHRESSALHFRC
jgi:hypothetical protein